MGIFKFLKRSSKTVEDNRVPLNTISSIVSPDDTPTKTVPESKPHLSEILPNGKTISEQQQEDYNIALGNYSNDTSTFLGMKIVSSTVPPQENYNCLNEEEQTFFSTLREKLVEAKYSPELVRLTRLSDGTFNVDYIGICYVGKIRLFKAHPIYAVIKKGNKKAAKLFKVKQEADIFANTNVDYEVQVRNFESEFYMQYMIGITSIKELINPSLQQCIDTIPRWIRYINYCKRN